MGKTYEVKAKAPPRDGFNGFWSAQRHWPGGQLVSATVDGRELRELLNDDKAGLLMVEDADDLREQLEQDEPQGTSTTLNAQGLTPDEAAALDAYRKSKAATVNQGELHAAAARQAKQQQDQADAKARATADAEAAAQQTAKGKGK